MPQKPWTARESRLNWIRQLAVYNLRQIAMSNGERSLAGKVLRIDWAFPIENLRTNLCFDYSTSRELQNEHGPNIAAGPKVGFVNLWTIPMRERETSASSQSESCLSD